MRNAFIHRLIELAAGDPRILLITGDLGYNALEPYIARFPQQYLNAGVAEQNMTGLATGLALEGHVVFTYSIANFTFMRCLEQIRNDAAYHDCNVNVVSVGGGFSYGQLGISHHATEDLAIMRSLPNTIVAAPCDDWEVAELTSAVVRAPGVSYLRLDRSTAGDTSTPGERLQLGKARVLRQGTDLTIAATGGVMVEALKAADDLARQGIAARVLSVHTIKPLDVEALAAAARETGGVITLEEHTVDGGLGGAVAEALLEAGVAPRFFQRIGLRSGFSSIVGNQQYLRGIYGIDAAAVCEAALCRLAQTRRPLRRSA